MFSLISRVVDSLRATRSSRLLTCASPNRDLTTRLLDRQHRVGPRRWLKESGRLAATRCTVLEMAPLVERTSGWSVRLPAKLTAAWVMVRNCCIGGDCVPQPDCRTRTRRPPLGPVPQTAFAGFRFPPEVIVLAVRWYLRFGLSYRDVEELLTERGVEVDHVTVYRWLLRFTPLLAEAARPCRHAVRDRWSVDKTYERLPGSGAISTVRSTSSGRSSTCWSPHSATPRQPVGSFSGPSARPRCCPLRWSRTEQRPTRSCWRSCSRHRGIEPSRTPTTGSRPTTAA